MKRTYLLLLSFVCLLGTAITSYSCVDDEEGKPNDPTGVKGRPSSFVFGNKSYNAFYYNTNNQLVKMAYSNVAHCEIKWEGSQISSCYMHFHQPEGSDIKSVTFERTKDNDIIARKVLYDGQMINNTIYLDEDGYPTRIAEPMEPDESYYAFNLTFDKSKRLQSAQYALMYRDTAMPEYTFQYSYDEGKGSTNQLNSPVWFNVFYNLYCRHNTTDRQLLNYVNNLTLEVMVDYETTTILLSAGRSYKYDEDNYPTISVEAPQNNNYAINY